MPLSRPNFGVIDTVPALAGCNLPDGPNAAIARGLPFEIEQGTLRKDGRYWGISKLTAHPRLAVLLRYGLAVILVATALAASVITHLHNSPPRFVSHFVLIAIAIAFWCAGTRPGLLALLLSCLGVDVLARNHFLTAEFPLVQFQSFFVVFSLLMSLFSASRRRAQELLIKARDTLELRVVERTDELVKANQELRNTQAELQSREDYLAEAQRLSHTGSFGWKVSTAEVHWSDESYRILGYPREMNPTLELAFDRIHPEDRDRIREALDRAAQNGTDLDFEHRFVMPDGPIKTVHTVAHAARDNSGNLEYIGACTDITEHKRDEDKLRRAFEEIKELRDQLREENLALKEEIDHASMFEEVVGSSDPLRRALNQVEKVAPTDSTVLITGETGTGKELIARAMHKRSKRAGRAFIGVNCGAIPGSLVASELFGHEKGAFTGATQRRLGRFEAANGGTIFLDEVGDLPPDIQIALLRVLQEREIERVGSDKPIPVNVRVLAATHRDLEKLVSEGEFRQDLLYRLNVVPIHMPSLRERAADIPSLVEYFIARFGKKAGKKFRTIDKKTLKLFQAYGWPGNVRELQNVIERAVILSDSDSFAVDETWLKREPSEVPRPTAALSGVLLKQEKEMIEAALAESRGRVSGPAGAATKLGLPAGTLDAKIKRLGIDKYRLKSQTG